MFRKRVQRARLEDSRLKKQIRSITLREQQVRRRKKSEKRQACLELEATKKRKLQSRLATLEANSVNWHTKHVTASVFDGGEFAMVPVKTISIRVAKFDVVLREEPLRAAHAMHTILTRMVKFRCLV